MMFRRKPTTPKLPDGWIGRRVGKFTVAGITTHGRVYLKRDGDTRQHFLAQAAVAAWLNDQ